MEFLEQIRIRVHNYFLEKEMLHPQIKRSSVFLDNASSVGILFDATLPDETKIAQDFAASLAAKGKKVVQLGYFDGKTKDESFGFDCFSKSQLDWALRPKTTEALNFAGQPFDLLLNLSIRPVLPLDYLAAHSKARFRVGPFTEKTFCYDLMIDQDEKKGLNSFLAQALGYLEKMQPKKSSQKKVSAVARG